MMTERELAEMAEFYGQYFECITESCKFCYNGICRYPMICERQPVIIYPIYRSCHGRTTKKQEEFYGSN